ncbi:hypothetical protein Hanom_Chr07g00589551 [Helianthus anomalus]
MLPVSSFLPSLRTSRSFKFIREEGNLLEILFPCMFRYRKCKEPNVLGISPNKLLFSKFKTTNHDHFSQHSGISPDKLLFPELKTIVLVTPLEHNKGCNDPRNPFELMSIYSSVAGIPENSNDHLI